jgi:hypothetical protein
LQDRRFLDRPCRVAPPRLLDGYSILMHPVLAPQVEPAYVMTNRIQLGMNSVLDEVVTRSR